MLKYIIKDIIKAVIWILFAASGIILQIIAYPCFELNNDEETACLSMIIVGLVLSFTGMIRFAILFGDDDFKRNILRVFVSPDYERIRKQKDDFIDSQERIWQRVDLDYIQRMEDIFNKHMPKPHPPKRSTSHKLTIGLCTALLVLGIAFITTFIDNGSIMIWIFFSLEFFLGFVILYNLDTDRRYRTTEFFYYVENKDSISNIIAWIEKQKDNLDKAQIDIIPQVLIQQTKNKKSVPVDVRFLMQSRKYSSGFICTILNMSLYETQHGKIRVLYPVFIVKTNSSLESKLNNIKVQIPAKLSLDCEVRHNKQYFTLKLNTSYNMTESDINSVLDATLEIIQTQCV